MIKSNHQNIAKFGRHLIASALSLSEMPDVKKKWTIMKCPIYSSFEYRNVAEGAKLIGNFTHDEVDIKRLHFVHHEHNTIEQNLKDLYFTTNMLYQSSEVGEKFAFVGGDHSVSIATCSAFSNKYENSCIVYMDSSFDFNNNSLYVKDKVSSALYGEISNLSMYPRISHNDILFIGLRNFGLGELERLDTSFIHAQFCKTPGMTQGVYNFIDSYLGKYDHVHISFDVHVMDNYIFPCASNNTPHGLEFNHCKKIIKHIASSGKVRSMDIVEFNPETAKPAQVDCALMLNELIKIGLA